MSAENGSLISAYHHGLYPAGKIKEPLASDSTPFDLEGRTVRPDSGILTHTQRHPVWEWGAAATRG